MTKEDYQKVIIDVGFILSSLEALETSLTSANMDMDTYLSVIEDSLLAIDTAAQDKLDIIKQEGVMEGFLSEMKIVFDKYAARMEVGSSESGYGISYGTGEAVGIKLTATIEGVTGTKEINKSVIISEDLV